MKMKYGRDSKWRFEYPAEEGMYWLSDRRKGGGPVELVFARRTDGRIRLFRRSGERLDLEPHCGSLPPDVEVSVRIGDEKDGPSAQVKEGPDGPMRRKKQGEEKA